MSEYDGPGRSDEPRDEEPRPQDRDEDTRPLWDRPTYSQQQDQWQHQQPYGGHYPPYAGHQNPYAHQTMQMPAYGYPQQHGAGRVPGWVWPVVAVTALVVGLLGGTIGGVAVSSSLNDGPGAIFTGDGEVAAPLEVENGSVAAVAAQLLPSTVQILARNGGESGGATGSGFVIDRSGHVITNNHVVAEAAASGRIQVIDHEGKPHGAEIVGRSPVYDIAVLKIEDGGGLRPAALGSSRSMNVGETVVAIGSPLGLDSTVTSGIVSALDRPVTTGDEEESSFINAVQTDAAINPGNSGGPLVNLRGEVVGVNSAIATMGGAFTGETGNIGVGFAIPMEQVQITATQILRTGEAQYPVIGANVDTGAQRNGAEVVGVPAGTPADAAGLEKGDVVVAVDDVAVTDGIGLIVAIRAHQPGDTVALRVRRDGSELTVRIELDGKTG